MLKATGEETSVLSETDARLVSVPGVVPGGNNDIIPSAETSHQPMDSGDQMRPDCELRGRKVSLPMISLLSQSRSFGTFILLGIEYKMSPIAEQIGPKWDLQ